MGQTLGEEEAREKLCRHMRGKNKKCVASKCMAWQWQSSTTYYRKKGYCAADHVVFTRNVRNFN